MGIYATLITIAAVSRLFGDLGLEKILNVKIPSFSIQDRGKEKIRFLVRRIILIRAAMVGLISFLLWLACPIIMNFLGREELLMFRIPLIFYFSVSVFLPLFYMLHQAPLRIKTVALVDGGEKIGTLLLLTFFFSMGYEVQGALFAYVVSGILVVWVLAFLGRDFIWGRGEREDSKDLVKIGFTAVVYGLVSMGLSSQIDVLLMNWFHIHTRDIGFYYLGFNLAVMLGLFSQGIGGISQSVFSEAYTREGAGGLGIAWKMVTKVFILMAIPFYIFALFYASSIFSIFYGGDYLGAAEILQVFILSITVRIIMGSSFCMPAFYLLHQKRKGVSIQIVGGVLNLFLDLLLIPLYGVWGAVVATAFSLVLAGLGQALTLSRRIGVFPPLLFAGKILLACLLALLPTLLLEISTIYTFLVAGIVYGVAFLSVMSIVKPLGEEEKEMVKMVNPHLAAVVKYF